VKTVGLYLFALVPLTALGQGPLGSSISFESLDVNGDGRIDKEEAREESRLNVAFLTYDTDGDGVISRREYQRFLGPRAPRPAL
jgi:Ca2+-binding EF-hand superfamily protein